jgi:hypothetical protein
MVMTFQPLFAKISLVVSLFLKASHLIKCMLRDFFFQTKKV